MDARIPTALIVIVGVPAIVIGYVLLVEQVLRLAPDRLRDRARPWLWIAPALALLGFFLVYPTIATAVRSFQNSAINDPKFIGLNNYAFFFSNGTTLEAFRNSIIWLIGLTAFVVIVGLLAAILFDRVRYESVAKSLLFLPLAISFVGAGVIWKFMYDYQAGPNQIGTLNGILTSVGLSPQPFLINGPWNNIWLIIIGAWIWTGFAMVILSASLKGISPELLEAARVDGANELQVFRAITLPLLMPTIAVVATTMIITALKSFDVIYVTTNGNFGTDVLALDMYKQLFVFAQPGRAAAVATVLVLLIIPVMAVNIRRFVQQEAIR